MIYACKLHLKLALISPLLFCFCFIKKLHYSWAGIVLYYGIAALVLFCFNTALPKACLHRLCNLFATGSRLVKN